MMSGSMVVWLLLVVATTLTGAQNFAEPALNVENGTISILSERDVVFQLFDNSSGTPDMLSTSIVGLKQSIDTNRATIGAVSSALAATNTDTSLLSNAISSLVSFTVPTLSAATATVASGALAANNVLGAALETAAASLAIQASRASDLYGVTTLLSTALDAAQSYARSLSTAVSTSGVSVSSAVSYVDSVSAGVMQRVEADETLSTAIATLSQNTASQITQVNMTLRDALQLQALALSDSTASQASRITGVSTALQAAVTNLGALSTSVFARINTDNDLSNAIITQSQSTAAQVNQVSAALRTLVSTQTVSLSAATQAQADRLSGVSTAAQTTLNELSTGLSTRVALDLDRSSAIVSLSQSASNAVSQLSTAVRTSISAQSLLISDSTASQASRVTGLSTALQATITNLGVVSTATFNAQAMVNSVSTNVGLQFNGASTITANLASNVYLRTVSDTLLSTAVATLSTATVQQVSTLNFQTSNALAARLLTSSFLTTLQVPFNMNIRAPTPSSGVVSGISGCVLWLDAMNYYSVNIGNPNLWNDISQGPNGIVSARNFGWISLLTNAPGFPNNGAFHFNGNGYFTNSACTFLPYGSTARTVAFWARPDPSNLYIHHLFHYGTDGAATAWGPTFINHNALDPGQTSFNIHQWGTNYNVPGSWVHGEVAFFAVTYNPTGAAYRYSKNGAATAAVGTASPVVNTVYKAGNGFCNVGSRVNPSEWWQGAISAVYMFNRILSDTEIATLYAATARVF